MSDHDRDSRWEDIYKDGDVESLPWFYPGLDPDFARVLERLGISGGEMLDLCTGPGTQAIAMAQLGYSVTAVDIARSAVRKAYVRASGQGLDIKFQEADIFESDLERYFDIIFDRGCYHVFPDERRSDYAAVVGRLLKQGGYLLLKCFSYREKRSEGPYRIAPDEIQVNFEELFEVVSIEDTVFHGGHGKALPQALFCVMRRR
ncbi:MAG: class I SAM-dependent methyltransferase [Thermoleophilia bacterium]|jgi:SAM-dependent methyltransferase